jgi:DNA-binding beta-propeller fold protein YncE
MRPTRHALLPVVACLAATLASPRAGRAQTFTVQKFDIGGEGGTDYITAEPGTRRVFVSRGTHVMVVDGATGKVLGDIPDTPRMHGVALAPKWKHGFTTNAGDSTVSMFDLETLALIRKIPTHTGGLDGIMYDAFSDRVILTNHSRPVGTMTAIDAKTGDIAGVAELEDTAPEGAASDGHGRIFVNNEGKHTIQVVDETAMKAVASWPLEGCEGPTGIAFDGATNRIFAGCDDESRVVDAKTGRVVAKIPNVAGVDALGWDPRERLIYVPGGESGAVTVAHQDGADRYTVVATVKTVPGAKTIAVDPVTHTAYLFQPEFGPAPAGAPAGPGGRPARGPIVHAWLVAIHH